MNELFDILSFFFLNGNELVSSKNCISTGLNNEKVWTDGVSYRERMNQKSRHWGGLTSLRSRGGVEKPGAYMYLYFWNVCLLQINWRRQCIEGGGRGGRERERVCVCVCVCVYVWVVCQCAGLFHEFVSNLSLNQA